MVYTACKVTDNINIKALRSANYDLRAFNISEIVK